MIKQCALIYCIVTTSQEHLSAEQIYFLARQQMPGIALATVYNNLNRLSRLGLIGRIALSGQPNRFDKNPAPHEHALCDCCGSLDDIADGSFFQVLQAHTQLELAGYELTLHHLCSHCRKG